MSDPMTNVQIEDVLSSIRRLVSEDLRPPVPASARAGVQPGKLVLTPALRIVPDVEAPASVSRAEVFSSVRKRVEFEPEPFVQPTKGFDSISHEAAAAVLEAALSRRADDWEPDGSEVASGSVDWTIEWDADEGIPESVEGATGKSRDDFSPVEDPVDPMHEEAQFVEMEPMIAAEPLRDEAFSVFEDDDETLVDEETLREIVRDIIREELQGGLGERITRNVRKLVRAEINQALATRDFE